MNVFAMEQNEDVLTTQEISPIETIPDEILVMIIEWGEIDCFDINDLMLNNLGKSINKVLDFLGNIELVCRRFNRCENSIVRTQAHWDLKRELVEYNSDKTIQDLTPSHLELFKFLSNTVKIKAINLFIAFYDERVSLKRHFAGLKDITPCFYLDEKLKRLFEKIDITYLAENESDKESYCNQLILFLVKGVSPNSVVSYSYKHMNQSRTLLGFAIEMKARHLIRFLLFRKAYFLQELDLNLTGADGITPLMLCLCNGEYELAKYLLKHGADPKICDKKGRTPLMLAIKYCQDFEKLLESTVLHKMLDQGIDVNAQDNRGRNAFYVACKRNRVNVIALLCQYGLQLNGTIQVYKQRCRKYFGERYKIGSNYYQTHSALGWAVYFQNKELVQLLLDRGADINGKFNKFKSMIEYARRDLHIESNPRLLVILQMLVDKETENLELGGVSCTLF